METLRLFCDVARRQSFSLAAADHDLTQSAASQRIGALERKLGVTLFDRSVRPLALTPAGEIFLEESRQILARYDRLQLRIAEFKDARTAGGSRSRQTVGGLQSFRGRGGPSGQVRVEAIYSAGIDLLNQLRDLLQETYPRVTVAIEYKRPEQVYDAVRRQRCDLGIVSYPRRWPGVGVIPLRDERMCVVCAPDHPLASRAKVAPSDLARYTMAGFEPSLPVARSIRRYLRAHRAQVELAAVFDNIDTIKSAVAVTDQFAILPRRTVQREAAAGSLAAVDLEPRLTRPLGIIHHRADGQGRQFTPAVQAFVDFLLQHAGPDVDTVNLAGPATARNGHLVGGRS